MEDGMYVRAGILVDMSMVLESRDPVPNEGSICLPAVRRCSAATNYRNRGKKIHSVIQDLAKSQCLCRIFVNRSLTPDGNQCKGEVYCSQSTPLIGFDRAMRGFSKIDGHRV